MLLAPLLLASLASAQGPGIEKESFEILGWNDACSVAVMHVAYPKFGEAIHGEPISTRIGTVTIEPSEEKMAEKWFYEAAGTNSWSPKAVAKFKKDLRKLGYWRKGFPETIRTNPSTEQPGVAETILSTETLSLRPSRAWPDATWRWSRALFSPLSTCVLLVFETRSGPPRQTWLLARSYNPKGRLERSRAHATNGRLLFGKGDLEGALAESEIAASLAPESGLARFHYAAMLVMSGRPEDAMVHLTAACKIDGKWCKDAKTNRDFEDLYERDDFKDLVGRHWTEKYLERE